MATALVVVACCALVVGQAPPGSSAFGNDDQHVRAIAAALAGPDFEQNPGDLTHQGGPTVESAESHAVFVNPGRHCTMAGCWGDPENFLTDLGRSDFIHLVEQYVGAGADQRYSPDNPATFAFWAYHDSVTFLDVGHVLLTVEPFQNVPGWAGLRAGPTGSWRARPTTRSRTRQSRRSPIPTATPSGTGASSACSGSRWPTSACLPGQTP